MKVGVLFWIWMLPSLFAFGQIDTVHGLVSYYPMNGNGDNAIGNGNNCSNHGAVLTTDRFGSPNSAYHFNGSAYLVSNYNTLGWKQITISAWVKTSTSNSIIALLQKEYDIVFYLNRFSARKYMVAMDGSSYNNSPTDQSSTDVTTGAWVFLAATNDGKQTRIYVNGNFEKSYSETLSTSNSQIEIGGAVGNSQTQFIGDIDDVKIYNRALSDSDVKNIYGLKRNITVCSGTSYPLTVGNAFSSYKKLWSNGDTSGSITVSQSGTYWVKLTNSASTITDTLQVAFFQGTVSGSGKSLYICGLDSVQMKAELAPGNSGFYWDVPTYSGQRTKRYDDSFWTQDTGYYYFIDSADAQCPNSIDTVHVKQGLTPVSIAGPDTILCYGQSYTMEGKGGITYKWIPASYLSSDTDPNAKAHPPGSAYYELVAYNTQGCSDTSHVWIRVRPPLTVKASAPNDISCYGQSMALFAIGNGGDSAHYMFNWANDSQNGDTANVMLHASGWHTVLLSDNCSQPISDSVYLKVIPPAVAAFGISPEPALEDHKVSFQNNSKNSNQYYWSFGSPGAVSTSESPTFIYTDTGKHTVMLVAYGLNGCPNDTTYATVEVTVGNIVIFVPNAFSPNSNGLNDYFKIEGTGIRSYTYNIYNRWGERLFESNTTSPAWDGTFKGSPVLQGVYIYQLEVTDIDGRFHFFSGNVTLVK